MKNIAQLNKATSVKITTLVDNYIDLFLPSTNKVKREPLISDGSRPSGLLAEHGLSLLVDVFNESEHHQILFDTGLTDIPLPYNLESMGINLDNVEAVVLGHGHPDHIGGLIRIYRDRLVPKHAPLVVHPEAFKQRLNDFGGQIRVLKRLDKTTLNFLGVKIQENTSPILLGNNTILITGEIERVTDFEKGFPPARKIEDGQIKPDTAIKDEQSLVINVKDKGLVILSSCGHPGIINTILYAQKLTGEKRIYFVMGGFHLTGPIFEPLIEPTINEMKKLNPEIVVPTHCTGWKAINEFAKEMPDQFILNSVGTSYML